MEAMSRWVTGDPRPVDPGGAPGPPAPPLPAEPPPMEAEVWSSWALLILVSLVSLTLYASYVLKERRVRYLHESVVSLLLGVLVGLILTLSGADAHHLRARLTFDHGFFFNLILPAILINSAYEMKKKRFFRSFGSIMLFAVLGTLITAFTFGYGRATSPSAAHARPPEPSCTSPPSWAWRGCRWATWSASCSAPSSPPRTR